MVRAPASGEGQAEQIDLTGKTRTVRTASVPTAWLAVATIRALISRSWVA